MPPRRARHHRCRRHTSPTYRVFTPSSNGGTVWCPAMVPPAGKNDAPCAPPPSPPTMSVKAFARMSTSPIHTVPVVAIPHPQQLPQLPYRKRSDTARNPTPEPPASTRLPPSSTTMTASAQQEQRRREGEHPQLTTAAPAQARNAAYPYP
jgi:hypothetical protein